jgi:hypothetical protein
LNESGFSVRIIESIIKKYPDKMYNIKISKRIAQKNNIGIKKDKIQILFNFINNKNFKKVLVHGDAQHRKYREKKSRFTPAWYMLLT